MIENDETAFERQVGVSPLPPRDVQDLQPDHDSLPYDSVWAEAVKEYFRLKGLGLGREAALQVFHPLLNDPARAGAARLMLDTAASRGPARP